MQKKKFLRYLAFCYSKGIGIQRILSHIKQDPNFEKIPSNIILNWEISEIILKWSEQDGNGFLTLLDKDYPANLKQITDPPFVLFIKGDPKVLQKEQVAIVGARDASVNGKRYAKFLASQLCLHGFVVTSGMAKGIDTAAHIGSLEVCGGRTIAVLGSGIENIYPYENKSLVEEVINKGGAVISEVGIKQAPIAFNFPKRNRIISGLSRGVVVIEAGIRSGSLITAKLALEQNREVFAVPGSIYNKKSQGCHKLLKEGAKLVEGAEDVLEELI